MARARISATDRDWIDERAADVWAFVFSLVDAEPSLTGDDAGRAAHAAEAAFREAMERILAVDA